MIETKGKTRHFEDLIATNKIFFEKMGLTIRPGVHDTFEVVCPEEHAERFKAIVSEWISGERVDLTDLKVFEGLGD